jgi:hypothetical protein
MPIRGTEIGKWKFEKRTEKIERGAVDGRASWGAAVLRPYTIVVSQVCR